jgi:YHS domain-containing protein
MLRAITLSLTLMTSIIIGAFAADAQRDPISDRGGSAIKGYDTVAYWTVGEALKGDKKITSIYKGAEFRFASVENKALFDANPEKYIPEYGGYCAWAIGKSATGFAVGNGKYWKIVDGKLYVNYSKGVQKKWEKDIPGFIKTGDVHWSQAQPKLAESN